MLWTLHCVREARRITVALVGWLVIVSLLIRISEVVSYRPRPLIDIASPKPYSITDHHAMAVTVRKSALLLSGMTRHRQWRFEPSLNFMLGRRDTILYLNHVTQLARPSHRPNPLLDLLALNIQLHTRINRLNVNSRCITVNVAARRRILIQLAAFQHLKYPFNDLIRFKSREDPRDLKR